MKPTTHFLIVDDYSNIRKLVKTQLNEFGITNVSEADSVDSAIALLTSNTNPPIEFILSDWNMPAKSGLDLLKWARSQSQYKNTPFLILTTENEQAKIMTAIGAGVSNFLLKPWESDELSEKILLCWKKHNP